MQVYKAIKYIRLSYTDDKTTESDSVANQRRLIDDYIARHPEIEVVAEKIDDGYSGVLFDRPAFQEMMRMIEQGEANCVIVKEDCVIIELNQKALENRDFVMWFCFFDPKTDTFYTLLAQGGGARRVERPQQHS